MTTKGLIRKRGLGEPQGGLQPTDHIGDKIESAAQKARAKLESEYAGLLACAVHGTLTERQAAKVVELTDKLNTSVRHFRAQTQELSDAIAKHKLIREWHAGGGESKFRELTKRRQDLLEQKKQALADFDDKIRLTDYEKSTYLRRRQAVQSAEVWLRELRQSPGFASAAQQCGFPGLLDDPAVPAKKQPEGTTDDAADNATDNAANKAADPAPTT